jgi:hypothetical protein
LETKIHNAPTFHRRTHVRVWGYPNTSRAALLAVATKIITDRWQGSMKNINVKTITADLMGRYVEVVYERVLGGFAGNILGKRF